MSSARRRVAITGLGLVTPAGNDVATTWDALLAGRSGVAPVTQFDASGLYSGRQYSQLCWRGHLYGYC